MYNYNLRLRFLPTLIHSTGTELFVSNAVVGQFVNCSVFSQRLLTDQYENPRGHRYICPSILSLSNEREHFINIGPQKALSSGKCPVLGHRFDSDDFI